MKIKKLIVNEDLVPQLEDNTDVTVFTNIISDLIKDEWEAIDGYNGAIISLSSMNREDAIAIMKDIISEEYIHIGQLEKLLQNVIPISNEMEKGATEAEEQIAEAPEVAEPENEPEELELRVEEEPIEESVEEPIDENSEETVEELDKELNNKIEEEENYPDDDIPMDIAESVTFKKKDVET